MGKAPIDQQPVSLVESSTFRHPDARTVMVDPISRLGSELVRREVREGAPRECSITCPTDSVLHCRGDRLSVGCDKCQSPDGRDLGLSAGNSIETISSEKVDLREACKRGIHAVKQVKRPGRHRRSQPIGSYRPAFQPSKRYGQPDHPRRSLIGSGGAGVVATRHTPRTETHSATGWYAALPGKPNATPTPLVSP